MPHAMLRTSEDIISDILNWVCPACGGRMGGRSKEFKCQGECLTDWRNVWESHSAKPGKNTNSPRALAGLTDPAALNFRKLLGPHSSFPDVQDVMPVLKAGY
jgi:tRNA(Ile2) C34 agmatinyltransferase TiaS